MIRPMIACVSLVAATSFFAGCSSQVNAQKQTASTKPSASRVRVECPNFKEAAVKQQTPVWCWAASAEMVAKYYDPNTKVTQEELAKEITNASKDDPSKAKAAGLQQIMVALNPTYKTIVQDRSKQLLDSGSTGLKVDYVDMAIGQTAAWSATSDDLIDAITVKDPAIVGLRGEGQSMGHAVVVYATSYEPVKNAEGRKFGSDLFGALAKQEAAKKGIREDQVDASGLTKGPAKYTLSEIEYVDPMDGKRYRLNAEGFKKRVDFIMTKPHAKEILDRQMNAVHS